METVLYDLRMKEGLKASYYLFYLQKYKKIQQFI
jgi:hypothetical protein